MRRDALRFLVSALFLGVYLAPSPAHALTRCEVLAHAKKWVDAHVMYSQGPGAGYCPGSLYCDPNAGDKCYRPDCSGFVSAVWGLAPPGHTTYSFATGPWADDASYAISKNELAPGDALNWGGDPNAGTGHIMLFGGWLDAAKSKFWVYEESECGTPAHYAEHTWSSVAGVYAPIRRAGIQANEAEVCNGEDDDCDGVVDEGDVCEVDELLHDAVAYDGDLGTDLNGDGRADACARAASGLDCHLATASGWGASLDPIALSDDNGWEDPANWSTIRFGDIDGNGKADVCARSNTRFDCWRSKAGGFGTIIKGPSMADADGWNHPEYFTTIRLLDFNGDGKADVCARNANELGCWSSTGSGFGAYVAGPAWSDDKGFDRPRYYGTFRAGDVNGDGRDDVCIRTAKAFECWLSNGAGFPKHVAGPAWSNAEGWGGMEYWSTIRLVDLDGDGKADVCARAAAGLECHRSLGTSFQAAAITIPKLSDAKGWSDPANYATIRFGDLNGDGKADVCARGNAGMTCWLWKDGGFGLAFDGPELSDAKGWDDPAYYRSIQLADMTGDGKADVCARAAAGGRCWPSLGHGFGAAMALADYADAHGWKPAKYGATLRMAGVHPVVAQPPACKPAPEECNGVDDDCDGVVDEGCDAGGAGGAGAGGAGAGGGDAGGAGVGGAGSVDAGAGGGGAGGAGGGACGESCDSPSDAQGDAAIVGGCSLALAGSRGDATAIALALGGLAASLVVRRKRARRR